MTFKWKERGRAAGLHLLASLAAAALAGLLVFAVWFPYPYREVSGGRELFWLIVTVDVILGPLLTFAVFNSSKPKRELWRDLAVIAILQLAALGYGLYVVQLARPIYLVHEVDRFKVVTLADIDPAALTQAQPMFRKPSWYGIRLIGLRPSRDGAETLKSIELAILGRDIAVMPERWQELDNSNRAQIRQRARDVSYLRGRAKDGGRALDELIASVGVPPSEVIGLPLVSRRSDWSVLLDRRDLRILGYLPIDAF